MSSGACEYVQLPPLLHLPLAKNWQGLGLKLGSLMWAKPQASPLVQRPIWNCQQGLSQLV